MRAVDLQQALGGGDRQFRLTLRAQEQLAERAATIAQAFAFGGEPEIECGIQAVEILQQVAFEQGERAGAVDGGAHDLGDVHPGGAGPQGNVVAGDLEDVVAGG